MPTLIRYTTALSLLLCCIAHAQTETTEASFLSAVQKALQAKDMSNVAALYDLHDASQKISDLTLQPWVFLFKDLDKGWVIQEAKYMSKSDFIASSTGAAADIQAMLEPSIIEGETYLLSPELVGVLRIITSKSRGNQEATMGVGLGAKGTLILMSLKKKQNG